MKLLIQGTKITTDWKQMMECKKLSSVNFLNDVKAELEYHEAVLIYQELLRHEDSL